MIKQSVRGTDIKEQSHSSSEFNELISRGFGPGGGGFRASGSPQTFSSSDQCSGGGVRKSSREGDQLVLRLIYARVSPVTIGVGRIK